MTQFQKDNQENKTEQNTGVNGTAIDIGIGDQALST